MRLRTHALTNSLAGAKLQHTIFPRPGLPVRFVVSACQRARKPNAKRKLAFKLCWGEAAFRGAASESACHSPFPFVDIAKLRTKKTQTKHFNETTWMAKKPIGQQWQGIIQNFWMEIANFWIKQRQSLDDLPFKLSKPYPFFGWYYPKVHKKSGWTRSESIH